MRQTAAAAASGYRLREVETFPLAKVLVCLCTVRPPSRRPVRLAELQMSSSKKLIANTADGLMGPFLQRPPT